MLNKSNVEDNNYIDEDLPNVVNKNIRLDDIETSFFL